MYKSLKMNKLQKTLLILFALLAFGPTAWAQFSGGTGTEADPYKISNKSDWNELANNVNNGNTYSGKFFKMTNHVSTVSEMVGDSKTNSFQGTFDGDGHTLHFYQNTNNWNYINAPFRHVRNATIKNLNTSGRVYAQKPKSAGIVAIAYDTVNIINCNSSMIIRASANNVEDGYHAGILSVCDDAIVNITNCRFVGQFNIYDFQKNGGIVGLVTTNATLNIANCLFAPESVIINVWNDWNPFDELDPKSKTFVGDNKGTVTMSRCLYTKKFDEAQGIDAASMTNSQLLYSLGSGWHEMNGMVVPAKTSETYDYPPLTGEGSEESPYLIASVGDWSKLAADVLLGETEDKYFKLTQNITLTEDFSQTPNTLLGISENVSFKGTFDGGGKTITVDYTDDSDNHYCAPFRFINGATIKNLRVTGIIRKWHKKHAGGFVGQAYGTNYITNCRSSVDIRASTNGDGSHGGFMGDLRGGTTYFKYCLFDGKLCGPNDDVSRTIKWGGFVGWVAKDTDAYFTYCIFAPTQINIADKSTSNTFARCKNNSDVHFTRNYYLTPFGTTQGKHARSISGVQYSNGASVKVEPFGDPITSVMNYTIYNLNLQNPRENLDDIDEMDYFTTYDIERFNTCFKYNNKYYSGNNDIAKLTLSQVGETPEHLVGGSFVATPGSLSETEVAPPSILAYNLSMPNQDVSITLAPADWLGEGTEESPWLIQNTEHWNLFCSRVNSGNRYDDNFFKLMADITIEETFSGLPSKQAGRDGDKEFRGTFDGNGHTMTVKYTDQSSNNYCAPFRMIQNATIQNLHVAGSITKNDKKHAAGIVGQAFGTNYLTNCRSSVDIFVKTDGDGSSGGLVGDVRDSNDPDDLIITNCLFDGKLRTNDSNPTTKWGGLVGWVTDDTDDPDVFFVNCLFAPTAVSTNIVNNSDSKTFARYDDGNDFHLTNSYYKTLIQNAQGAINALSLSNTELRTALGDGWEIVVENGVEKVLPATTQRALNGEGTVDSPYLIASADDWEDLSINVMLGETYSGKYFLMTEDISVDRTVGTYSSNNGNEVYNAFSGTFDGSGHTLTINVSNQSRFAAPFRCVEGATIKNLHTAGTIYGNNSDGKLLAGIVGVSFGNTNISVCISSVSLSTNLSDDAALAGLVAAYKSGDLTVENCLFNGSMTANTSHANRCGGLVGYRYGGNCSVSNSLFEPTELNVTTGDTQYSATIARTTNGAQPTITNCYYSEALGIAQGIHTYLIYNETLRMYLGEAWEHIGTQVQPILGVHSFENGDGTEDNPYLISSEDDWNRLASNVYLGVTYNDDYFKMTETSISVKRMVGTNESKYFQGTLDGNGKILYFNYENTEEYTAPFRFVKSATIKNLEIHGTITTSEKKAAGIIAHAEGNTAIINCVSGVRIDSEVIGEGIHGGLVAAIWDTANVIIDGCIFGGYLFGENTSHCGGLVGLTRTDNDARLTIQNSLFAPIETGMSTTGCATFSRTHDNPGDKISINNCYYFRPFGTIQGKQGRMITTEENAGFTLAFAGDDEIVYNLSKITSYGTGLKYEIWLYAGNGEEVSLNLITEPGYEVSNVTYTPQVEGGTATAIIRDENGVYTFTMPDADVTINATTQPAIYRAITGYGESEEIGWAFIASPVAGSIEPADVINIFSAEEYDLYRLNPSNTMWENYKNGTHSDFNLVNGMGYLYATKETRTLAFTGTFNTGNTMTLTDLPAGFNLVGNPFTMDAYVSKPYYTLNGDGSAILTTTSEAVIPPCYGVIVEVEGSESVIFTAAQQQQSTNNNGGLLIALSQADARSNALLDNAIVSFNEGEQLGKFYFGSQNANIYLPQDGKEYAIAFSEGQGEVPVNFKAKENGSYTISVNPEGVEMAYLHLIDNMTGADIDLLQTPNYSFNANVTDYESRFKLVFASKDEDGPSTGSGTFAFFSDGNWIIANEGEATLQVIDLTGRILSSETVNGSVSKAIHVAPGVYVIRLINGDEVKVQKIVVR